MRKVFILLSILCFSATILIQEYRPHFSITEKITFKFNERYPTFNAETIKLLSFGYERVLSNLLWIRFILQTPPERVPPNELSWIYFDLDTITNIDPEFLPAFEIGGLFLSVITTDKIGAERLFKKGIELHPDNWRVRVNLAYHYKFELDQADLAGEQYLIASKIKGAPEIVSILAARHLSKTDSPLASIKLLEELQKNTPQPQMKKFLQERIDMWKKKLKGSKND